MKGLRSASIRKQLLFLAILLVVLVSVVAATTEPFIYGRHDKGIEIGLFAGRIETVLEQYSRGQTELEEEAALRFADRLGIWTKRASVSRASMLYEAGTPNPEILQRVKELINDGIVTAMQNAVSSDHGAPVLTIKVDETRALSFTMPQFPTSVWLVPAMASGILKIVIPLILLAYLGSWLITEPVIRFAAAAQRVSMDDHSEEPFKAEGALEIRSLAASLNVMQGRIQTMLRERTRVLRAISHDLRTPLTRLRMRIERSNEPALREMMLADVTMLSSLIDTSLSFLDNTFEPARKVDLSSLLQTISDDFADTGVSTRFIGPRRLTYICMPQGLTRAVSNLVDNASRYADHIEIALEDRHDTVTITVSDDGPGLPDDLKEKVIEPFFKADASRQSGAKTGGFGLGLSIAQGIVVIGHKGVFTLRNRQPNGLAVEIILPKGEILQSRNSSSDTLII
ncbi:putative two-component histidine kinase [Agrobacterium rubi TR3 = NBRC 13261]|uniref:histidine kinase n=1 Tax=Agrobacterium rubi TR3 = NBRC 13261 TaxID=1368415 RepID=A0A081D183_9HYPH|nr:ATP-binding protein [Agrobacterium rubi]MBP1880507.1 signal transduction histidine kinase [Agrobacterium rubi]MCL6654871.1 two-component sensor histidine kinase [Agrobacterium rubi]GAK72679.1 putative two-component histidine kinase [Agrobacterium rubi TR3 = NBRC 13261]